jgi:hypothetical protein
LCEERSGASFDYFSRLMKDRMAARWHGGYRGFGDCHFCND